MSNVLLHSEIDGLSKLVGLEGEELFRYLKKLADEDKNNKFLNEYRGALSLWAEYTNDTKHRVIVTLDGRDTAGKGSNIRKVTEYFDLTRFDKKAYGIPSKEERNGYNWFNRYMKDFPDEGKVTFFDRSWYNRAGVEAAMGFCTQEEYNWFMENVNRFEKDQIIDMGISFIKVYLSVSKKTQKARLKGRETNMKAWKSSFIDKIAQEKWNYYTLAKAKMLEFTDSEHAPWLIVDSNKKFLSSIEIIKSIICTVSEVSSIVENELSIDLSLNKDISKTAKEELAHMKEQGDLEKMKSKFKFAKNDCEDN